jgi:hypothetical protein
MCSWCAFDLKKRPKAFGPHCVCILMLCVDPKEHSVMDSYTNNTRSHPAHHNVAVFCLGPLAFSY